MGHESSEEDALLGAHHQGVTRTQLACRQLPGRLVRLGVATSQLEHLVIAHEQKLFRSAPREQFVRDLAQAVEGDGVDLLARSEEHTSELQSRGHLVCRLLLEKEKGSLSKNRGHIAKLK